MDWEYFVHILDLRGLFTSNAINGTEVSEMLNWYGSQGWEFHSSFTSAGGHGVTVSIGFIFKRPRQPNVTPIAPQPMNT
jgi:hypothetical protein